MTTYTNIANSEIDTDSPVTESLMTRLRDNPVAITEGSTGAPKIQTAALEQTGGSEAVTTATIRASAVTFAKVSDTVSAAATKTVARHACENSATATVYTPVKEFVCTCSGTIYSTFELKSSDGSTVYGRIYKNGAALGTEHSTTSVTYVSKTDTSISVSRGDLLQIYVRHITTSQTAYAQDWRLYASAGAYALFNYSEL